MTIFEKLPSARGWGGGWPACPKIFSRQTIVLPCLSTRDSQHYLLWWQHDSGPDQSVYSAAGPGIDEREMSAVHFIIHSERLVGKKFKETARDFRRYRSVDTCTPRYVLRASSAVGLRCSVSHCEAYCERRTPVNTGQLASQRDREPTGRERVWLVT